MIEEMANEYDGSEHFNGESDETKLIGKIRLRAERFRAEGVDLKPLAKQRATLSIDVEAINKAAAKGMDTLDKKAAKKLTERAKENREKIRKAK